MDNDDLLRDIAFQYQPEIDEVTEFLDQVYFLTVVLIVGSNKDRTGR